MSVAMQSPVPARPDGGIAQAGSPSRRDFARYLAALAGGVLSMLALYYLLLFALQQTGNLPPPAFTNSICVDEKLRFHREHPAAEPDLLVVGSSVAWRHVDSPVLARASGHRSALNGGFCGMHVNQTEFIANWLLRRLPTVKHVLLIASPQDFAGCRSKPAAVFNADVTRYVFGNASPWPYYMAYFSPASLWRNARDQKPKRENRMELDALVITPSGDGPLDTRLSRATLLYGAPEPLDAACFGALRTLAGRLHAQGRAFTVVTTPVHPAWKAAHDPQGTFLAALDAGIRQAVGPARGRTWDAAREWTPDPGAFTDAIHLRWSAVRPFSEALGRRLREGAPAAPG